MGVGVGLVDVLHHWESLEPVQRPRGLGQTKDHVVQTGRRGEGGMCRVWDLDLSLRGGGGGGGG